MILSRLKSGTATLTFNRPSRANAFNFEMTRELINSLIEAEHDPRVRVLILTGAGRVFSSGQDITEMKQGEAVSYGEHLEKTYNPLILQIRSMGKPVLAAVNGPCAGAAFGIALACDLRIAHSSAYFVVGFSGIALGPDSGVSLLLPKVIGLGRAQAHFYSNQPIRARQAHEWGLVNQVGGVNFQRKVTRVAEALASGPPEAFAAGKKAFNQAILPNLEDALKYEARLQDKAGGSAEHRRGVDAFLGKIKPDYL